MNSIKPYAYKEWNDFDIPTPPDLQNIENGIFNNNSDIIALNDELTNYEKKILSDYETYKSSADASLKNEEDKLNDIKSKCDDGFSSLDNYENYVSSIQRKLETAREKLVRFENNYNKLVLNLVKNEYEEIPYNFTVDYSGTAISGFSFPSWVTSAHVECSRDGNRFTFDFSITGTVPKVKGPVTLFRIPCYITPANTLELYINGYRYKGFLQPDGHVFFENEAYDISAIEIYPINLNDSLWRYDIQNFYKFLGE